MHVADEQALRVLFIDAYRGIEKAFESRVNPILVQGPLRSMLHFHGDLIEAIERGDPDAAERAAADTYVETDVRMRLVLDGDKGETRRQTATRKKAG